SDQQIRICNIESEQLPFNHEDYAIFRHTDSGKWFAVFIAKTRSEFGLAGEGEAEIVSLKIRDPLLADMLIQQEGYLHGYPSVRWNWGSVVLDGTVPVEDICRLMDESYDATISKAQNQKIPLTKRKEALSEQQNI
ncbi:MAG: MmcQ/YjbR family DNA-binding protein, partial [Oscillospiraceae bacterium]|nr:MmcQ/YjbR family DNA-binding protein [Oscillospiraceae bacterium]